VRDMDIGGWWGGGWAGRYWASGGRRRADLAGFDPEKLFFLFFSFLLEFDFEEPISPLRCPKEQGLFQPSQAITMIKLEPSRS
jgi:hypothetical protein